MEIITTTPFGARQVTGELLHKAQVSQAEAPLPRSDKWETLRALGTARTAFGLSDRDLTVLAALLSFHPTRDLADGSGALIVFPSNHALSQRAHGMAESTLRRHLARLVAVGLIARHDSPNGKRYAARGLNGQIARAFGFDLRPLLVRATEIAQAAQAARELADRMRRLREDITLMKRDAIKLAAYGATACPEAGWDEIETRLLDIHRRSRRRLACDQLQSLRSELAQLLEVIGTRVGHVPSGAASEASESKEMSGNAVDSGRHYQNSKPEDICFEECQETGIPAAGMAHGDHIDYQKNPQPCRRKNQAASSDPATPEHAEYATLDADDLETSEHRKKKPSIPLPLVVKACPDIADYASDGLERWSDLCRTADLVRGMMGVSPDAWEKAVSIMGHETAAMVLACILQRIDYIKSPGGYLRCLTTKAEDGAFSAGPMVMALLTVSPTRRAS